jgi:iron-binding CDGSH zinc finger protein
VCSIRRRRPWVDLTFPEAEADAVADAVLRCPTGVLHFEPLDGAAGGDVSLVRVTPIPKEPLYLRGGVEIFDEAGQLIRHDTRVAICRCGKSRHMPFCDNSHRAKVRITLGEPAAPEH